MSYKHSHLLDIEVGLHGADGIALVPPLHTRLERVQGRLGSYPVLSNEEDVERTSRKRLSADNGEPSCL